MAESRLRLADGRRGHSLARVGGHASGIAAADVGRDSRPLVLPAGWPRAADRRPAGRRRLQGALAHSRSKVRRSRRRSLRGAVVPTSGLDVKVGGATASFVDQGEITANRLPLFVGGVVGLSFLLLLAAFKAPVVALKAGVMNLLSIAAAYGVVALVADGGVVGGLVGIDTPTPVPPFIPVMMFAILFGLSMDYEVFLLSRIREAYGARGETSGAVVEGLARTARVITAAAAIMVAVFGAFVLSGEVFLKLIGVGLASAVLIDATVVRMVLVPAVMQLLGERNWWLPRWLDQAMPRVELEPQPAESR